MVCKYFYIIWPKQELGIDNDTINGSTAYKHVDMFIDAIVTDHTNMLTDYGINLDVDKTKIPVICWTAKLHKAHIKRLFQ